MKDNSSLQPTECKKTDCFAYVFRHGESYCYVLNSLPGKTRNSLCSGEKKDCKFYKSYKDHDLWVPEEEWAEVLEMREKGWMH